MKQITKFKTLLVGLFLISSTYSWSQQVLPFKIPDPNFFKALLWQCDSDKNGIISFQEAASIPNNQNINAEAQNITSLEGFQYFVNCGGIIANGNNITTLDVSKFTNMAWLEIENNPLISLTGLDKCPKLYWLDLANTQLTSIDITKNYILQRLRIEGSKISTLNLSNNIQLQELFCDATNMSSLDLRCNIHVWGLTCSSNPLLNTVCINSNIAHMPLLVKDPQTVLSLNCTTPTSCYTNAAITTGTLNNPYCKNNIPFTAKGFENKLTIFTAQLSDANGSFASPVSIGTLTVTPSDPYTGSIPVTTFPTVTQSSNYQIRVVATTPAVTGTSVSVTPCPSATITTSIPLPYCKDNVTFVAKDFPNGSATFIAQLSDASGSFSAPTNIGTLNVPSINSASYTGSITPSIPVNIQGANYQVRVVSTSPQNVIGSSTYFVSLANALVTYVSPQTPINPCLNEVATLTADCAHGTNPNVTYHWTGPGVDTYNKVISVKPSTDQVYTLTAQIAAGCTATTQTTVRVANCLPTITTTLPYYTYCNDNIKFSLQNFAPGTYIFTAQLIDANGNTTSLGTITRLLTTSTYSDFIIPIVVPFSAGNTIRVISNGPSNAVFNGATVITLQQALGIYGPPQQTIKACQTATLSAVIGHDPTRSISYHWTGNGINTYQNPVNVSPRTDEMYYVTAQVSSGSCPSASTGYMVRVVGSVCRIGAFDDFDNQAGISSSMIESAIQITNADKENLSIHLMTVDGRILKTINTESDLIDLNVLDLNSGIYILNIETGTQNINKKYAIYK